MKTQYNFKAIGVAALLTVLICTGIHLYAQWDLTRFKASLREVPKSNAPAKPASQKERQTLEYTKYPTPTVPVESEPLLGTSGEPEITKAGTDIENAHLETRNDIHDSKELIFSREELLEGILDKSVEPYDLEVEPYDLEKVGAGFRNYNAFLSSNPERAYASLTDALREQYGNYSAVDIIVETVRRVNDGIATFDDAIAMRETLLRLTPPENTEEVGGLSYGIKALYELKALKAEGEPVGISFNITFGE